MAHPVKDLPLAPMLQDMLDRLNQNMQARGPMLDLSECQDPANPSEEEREAALRQHYYDCFNSLESVASDFSRELPLRLHCRWAAHLFASPERWQG